jgi:predicted HTH transcriptional regulator
MLYSVSENKTEDKMEEHRGRHRVELFKKNRELVREWLKENPSGTMKDCSVDLKLSYLTTRQHIKAVLKETELFYENRG